MLGHIGQRALQQNYDVTQTGGLHDRRSGIILKFSFIGEESGQQFIVYVCKNAKLTSNVLNKAFVLQLVRVLGVILS